jgi:hypothetical protein
MHGVGLPFRRSHRESPCRGSITVNRCMASWGHTLILSSGSDWACAAHAPPERVGPGAATVPEVEAWADDRTSRLASGSGRSRFADADRTSVSALTRPFFGQTGMTAGRQGHRGICNAETTWTLHESGSIGRQPMIVLDLLAERSRALANPRRGMWQCPVHPPQLSRVGPEPLPQPSAVGLRCGSD